MKLSELCSEPLPAGLDLPAEVYIGSGLVDVMPEVIPRYLGKRVLLVADPDTWDALQKSETFAAKILCNSTLHLLPRHPHAGAVIVEEVVSLAEGMTGLVAIGSGTINDIVKLAATQKGLPYIVLGTALSMNGYASGIAAIFSEGLKISVAAKPPRAIVMDTDILRAAPPALAQAGLGDLLSKPVSMADWWLGKELEGTAFSSLPGRLVDRAVSEAASKAAGLPTRDVEAYEALARALVLMGVSMVVAGSSAPASGAEHLLSHLWDMEALVANRKLNLHGAQVGVATCIIAALYQRLLDLEHPPFTDPPAWDAEESRICADHGPLANSVLKTAKVKHARAGARVSVLRKRWFELRQGLSAMDLPTPDQMRATLRAAGAVHTLSSLGLQRADAARALRIARDIRDRITVLDLAFELGICPDAIEEVLDDSGV